MKLKDKVHPYYCSEGNYYNNECYYQYDSFDEFLNEWGDCDIDYNRIHRWDINEYDESPSEVSFYYVLQRKARLLSCHFPYKEEDEGRIRDFLRPHKELNDKLWDISE